MTSSSRSTEKLADLSESSELSSDLVDPAGAVDLDEVQEALAELRAQGASQKRAGSYEMPELVDDPELRLVVGAPNPAAFSTGPEHLSTGSSFTDEARALHGNVLDEALGQVLAQGASQNTVRSYRTTLAYWQAWHWLRFRARLTMPLTVGTIETFVFDHMPRLSDPTDALATTLPADVDAELVRLDFKAKTGPPALGTAIQRLSVMSWAHQKLQQPNPLDTPQIRARVAFARRSAAVSGRPLVKRKSPITRDVLHQLLATCDDSLHGVRDRALLLFAFSTGGRRRSEVRDAVVSRLERRGEAGFVYTLEATGTSQANSADSSLVKPVAGIAAAALSRWLELGHITSGPLFRSIDRFGRIGGKLSGQSVTQIVKKRARLASISDDLSAHSLRSGFATEANSRGVSIDQGMALSGHRSVTTYAGYQRPATSPNSRATRLADED